LSGARTAEGVFGGTFNPIHRGHLESARSLLEVLPLRHLRFVPAAVPPHREAPAVRAEDRARMVELAVAGDERLSCDRRELDRPGPSYTVDTLASLRDELDAGVPLTLVVGCDAFLGLESWSRWESLLELADIAVLARPGWSLPSSGAIAELVRARRVDPAQLGRAGAGRIVTVTLEPWSVSATQIRALLQSGQDASERLPAPVSAYIREHDLYSPSATG